MGNQKLTWLTGQTLDQPPQFTLSASPCTSVWPQIRILLHRNHFTKKWPENKQTNQTSDKSLSRRKNPSQKGVRLDPPRNDWGGSEVGAGGAVGGDVLANRLATCYGEKRHKFMCSIAETCSGRERWQWNSRWLVGAADHRPLLARPERLCAAGNWIC